MNVLTKKRGNSLDVFGIQTTNNSLSPKIKSKTIISIDEYMKSFSKSEQVNIDKDSVVKQWLGERFKDKLQRASRISVHTHKPILLYRKSIEESENAVEEEISYISGSYIVQVIHAYGGFVPSNFKSIEVFTVDKFTKWMLQDKKKELLLQCIEELEQNKI